MKFVKSSLLVKLVILILVVYATVTLVSLRQQINEKNEQEAILNSSIASTRQENNRLQDSIDAWSKRAISSFTMWANDGIPFRGTRFLPG